jgi:hypothetical protein
LNGCLVLDCPVVERDKGADQGTSEHGQPEVHTRRKHHRRGSSYETALLHAFDRQRKLALRNPDRQAAKLIEAQRTA